VRAQYICLVYCAALTLPVALSGMRRTQSRHKRSVNINDSYAISLFEHMVSVRGASHAMCSLTHVQPCCSIWALVATLQDSSILPAGQLFSQAPPNISQDFQVSDIVSLLCRASRSNRWHHHRIRRGSRSRRDHRRRSHHVLPYSRRRRRRRGRRPRIRHGQPSYHPTIPRILSSITSPQQLLEPFF
jgi:hypothetical protein